MTEGVTYFKNFNIEDVITPVDVKKLDQLLSETSYDVKKREKLIDGFTYGFEYFTEVTGRLGEMLQTSS